MAAVTTNAATDITYNSFKANGDLTDLAGYASVSVFFQYRVEPIDPYAPWDSYTDTAKQVKTVIGVYDATISGLDPDSDYQFRAAVEFHV